MFGELTVLPFGSGQVGDTLVMVPWEGLWPEHRRADALPGAVTWMQPEERRSYVIGTVTAQALEVAQ